MATPYCVVLVTVSNKEEGRKLAQSLLEQKLAACVNIVPGVESRYWWEGKIESAAELLLLVKTRESLVEPLSHHIKKHHSYSNPEVVSLRIEHGSKAYLDWLGANTLFVPDADQDKPGSLEL